MIYTLRIFTHRSTRVTIWLWWPVGDHGRLSRAQLKRSLASESSSSLLTKLKLRTNWIVFSLRQLIGNRKLRPKLLYWYQKLKWSKNKARVLAKYAEYLMLFAESYLSREINNNNTWVFWYYWKFSHILLWI